MPALPLLAFAGVGGLLAAGVIGGLARRRRIQLQARPIGRRILHPDPETATAEVALGAAQRPLDAETIDIAQRAVAAHCRATGAAVPSLTVATLNDAELMLTLASGSAQPPLGFRAHADGWRVTASEARYLSSVPGIAEAMRPYPALVGLGHDRAGRRILVNLEELGVLDLAGDGPRATELLAAMTVELAFGPAADELILTVVGDRSGLPDALDKHNVTTTDGRRRAVAAARGPCRCPADRAAGRPGGPLPNRSRPERSVGTRDRRRRPAAEPGAAATDAPVDRAPTQADGCRGDVRGFRGRAMDAAAQP